jgi:hypothetical protein
MIELEPDKPEGHVLLGVALSHQGRLAEALASFQRGLERHKSSDPRKASLNELIKSTEQLLEIDRKVDAVLQGETKPANVAECLTLADFCRRFPRHRLASVRFYAEAFAAQPDLATDLHSGNRYRAGCAAALASAGRGDDAGTLDARERARLRRQALDWLRADLHAWARLASDGNSRDRDDANGALRQWRETIDLTSVRHPWSLLRLAAEERRPWQHFWADVDALRARTGEEQ